MMILDTMPVLIDGKSAVSVSIEMTFAHETIDTSGTVATITGLGIKTDAGHLKTLSDVINLPSRPKSRRS